MQTLTRDEGFWKEQVRHPAVCWMGPGAMALRPGRPAIAGDRSRSRSQWIRSLRLQEASEPDKRAAKKKRGQEQRLKSVHRSEATAENDKKGTGNGKSKEFAGFQLCFI